MAETKDRVLYQPAALRVKEGLFVRLGISVLPLFIIYIIGLKECGLFSFSFV